MNTRLFFASLMSWFFVGTAMSQTANPTISFSYYEDDESRSLTEVEMNPGESQTQQAPLDIHLTANVEPTDADGNVWNYTVEWRIYNSDKGENDPVVNRFTEESDYTLTSSGGYGAKLYVTFVSADNDTTEYVSDEFKIVISESKLTCTDALTPNDDNINDKLVIEFQSIVKVSGGIWNRWGKKLHTFTLENLADGWDGRYGGDYVPDGAYILHIDAIGSDGLHYKIRKAISVLKGFREGESGTGTGTGNTN